MSNDNPYNESQFKTIKHQPDCPQHFENVEHARLWLQDYVSWYNGSHHRSGLSGYTPEQVFTGRYPEVALAKQQALDAQYQKHPERFVKGPPVAPQPCSMVTISPVQPTDDSEVDTTPVNIPTLSYAKNTLTFN